MAHMRVMFLIITMMLILLCCTFSPTTTASTIALGAPYLQVTTPAAMSGHRVPVNLATFALAPPPNFEATLSYARTNACDEEYFFTTPYEHHENTVVIVERGGCQFLDKIRVLEKLPHVVGVLFSNVLDGQLIVPVSATALSADQIDTPLVVGSIYGSDGEFLRRLLLAGIPVRVKVVDQMLPKPM